MNDEDIMRRVNLLTLATMLAMGCATGANLREQDPLAIEFQKFESGEGCDVACYSVINQEFRDRFDAANRFIRENGVETDGEYYLDLGDKEIYTQGGTFFVVQEDSIRTRPYFVREPEKTTGYIGYIVERTGADWHVQSRRKEDVVQFLSDGIVATVGELEHVRLATMEDKERYDRISFDDNILAYSSRDAFTVGRLEGEMVLTNWIHSYWGHTINQRDFEILESIVSKD